LLSEDAACDWSRILTLWVRDGIFEIDDNGVRAVQGGAFGRKESCSRPANYRKSTRFRRLTLAAVNYNTSIGLESSSELQEDDGGDELGAGLVG